MTVTPAVLVRDRANVAFVRVNEANAALVAARRYAVNTVAARLPGADVPLVRVDRTNATVVAPGGER